MLRFYENGNVGLKDAFLLPDSQWKTIAGCATIAGYGIESPEEAEAIYSRLADEAPGGEYIFIGDRYPQLEGFLYVVLDERNGLGKGLVRDFREALGIHDGSIEHIILKILFIPDTVPFYYFYA